jgi:hypothetical protein
MDRQNGLLAFRWYKYVGAQPHSPSRPGRWFGALLVACCSSRKYSREGEHDKHSWIAFGVITSIGLINAFIVFIGRDGAYPSAAPDPSDHLA